MGGSFDDWATRTLAPAVRAAIGGRPAVALRSPPRRQPCLGRKAAGRRDGTLEPTSRRPAAPGLRGGVMKKTESISIVVVATLGVLVSSLRPTLAADLVRFARWQRRWQ